VTDDKSLTKGQRRRANERRRKKAAEHFLAAGPMPAYTAEFLRYIKSKSNLDRPLEKEPWMKAPAHMVEYDEWPSLKKSEVGRLSRAGCEGQVGKRDDQISDMKFQYSRYWGKRGGAKKIAERERASGNPISERTILRYFRVTKP
jgi:hypothetical protein